MSKNSSIHLNHIRYARMILVTIGLLMVLLAQFVDLSWLIEIGDSYAADGDCVSCEILNNPEVILIPTGLLLIFVACFLKEMMTRKISKSKWYILLFIVILVGLLLRLNLAYETLFWQDEAESAIDTINFYRTGQLRGSYRDLPINYAAVGKEIDQPFFKYAHSNRNNNVVHGWLTFAISAPMLLFGKNSFLMRLPFSLLFIFSAIMLYVLSDRLTKDNSVAMLATLLYSTNIILIPNEMQLRYYSLMISVSLLLLILLTIQNAKLRNIFLPIALILSYHTHMALFAAHMAFVLYVYIQQNEQLSNSLLVAFGIILLQSYLFNVYTDWNIHRVLPLFSSVKLIYLKAAYSGILILLVTMKIFQKRLNNVIARINMNNPLYVLTLVTIFIIMFVMRKQEYLMIILGSVVVFIYLKSNSSEDETYFLLYSLICLSLIPFLIKPRFRNIFPCIPIIIVIASSIIVKSVLKNKRFGLEYKSFVIVVVVFLMLFSSIKAAGIKEISYNIHLRELVNELKKEKYANNNVFVEYNHFPLLFYTDISKLFYIWNINPRYFETTSDKYFIVLEPDRNPNRCKYYYRRFPELLKECEADPRFFLRFASGDDCSRMTLESGARIIECN